MVEDEGCQPEMEYEDEFEIENQEAATHPATSIAGKNSVNTLPIAKILSVKNVRARVQSRELRQFII